MTIKGRRVLLRCLLVCGLVLCLSPIGAQFWVTWKLILKPIFESDGKPPPQPNQLELQMAMRHDPVFEVSIFVLAPVGLAMVVFSLVRLRRLSQQPPPPLPDDYGLNRGGQ